MSQDINKDEKINCPILIKYPNYRKLHCLLLRFDIVFKKKSRLFFPELFFFFKMTERLSVKPEMPEKMPVQQRQGRDTHLCYVFRTWCCRLNSTTFVLDVLSSLECPPHFRKAHGP